jgi:glycerol-3-phosphate dehydrogenase (NAD(P)+)
MMRVAVLGAGAMGTALATLFGRKGLEVRLWAREPEVSEAIGRDRENTRFLPGIALPATVSATSDRSRTVDAADLIVAAIPCAFLRRSLDDFAATIAADVPVLSVVKGIEEGSFARPSRIVLDVLGARPVAVLSGPSHAEEFARGLPASVVVASSDRALAERVRDALRSDTFRIYLNRDMTGVELAGALKNVLGIAAGICDGLGFGDNAKAALLTRGLVEFARFAADLGAEPATFWGLAGVGDMLTTCYSRFGRNRDVGEKIGRGATLEQARAGRSDVAEGVFTVRSVHAMATASGLDMPITAEVHAILFDGKEPRLAVTDLMGRDPKHE